MYYIYEIENLINGKTYVGQRKCPMNILPEDDKYMGSGELIRKAIKAHGVENFVKSILERDIETKKEADVREIWWIAERKKIGKSEYNISLGGTGGYLGEEVVSLLRKNWHDNYEYRCSVANRPEFKERMRDNLIERHKQFDFSNYYTEEVRSKQSESQKKAWDKYREIRLAQRKTDEYRKAVSMAKKGVPVTDEHKKKISESVKKLHQDPVYKERFHNMCKQRHDDWVARKLEEIENNKDSLFYDFT